MKLLEDDRRLKDGSSNGKAGQNRSEDPFSGKQSADGSSNGKAGQNSRKTHSAVSNPAENLRDARQALAQKQFDRAEALAKEVEEQDDSIVYGLFDDTPKKILDAVRSARPAGADNDKNGFFNRAIGSTF